MFMRRMSIFGLVAALAVTAASSALGALSGNLIQGGDFEDTAYLKNSDSLDASNVLIPIQRFNQDADPGLWLAQWGPPSLGGNAGFSLYDDPRDLLETGGDVQATGDLGNMNRSVDPTDGTGTNHVMEAILFRPRIAQWIPAPANHVAGPIHFEFDFYLNRWDPPGGAVSANGASTNLQMEIYGTNELPAHNVGYAGDGDAVDPRGAVDGGSLTGELVARFNWGDWWSWPNTPETAGNTDGWLHVASDDLTHWEFGAVNDPGVVDGKQDVLNTSLAQTYPYYVVAFRLFTYHEAHTYFWLWGGKITDVPAIMVDNVVLELSVAPAGIPGDFDGSGVVDTQDINPFVLALTNNAQYQLTYGVDPVIYDTNSDGVIDTQDINPFIAILTGAGQTAIVPEPASLGLLAIGGLAIARRRRR